MTTAEIIALAAVIATVFVSLINAIATYRTTLANNNHQQILQREQREQDLKKAQIESDTKQKTAVIEVKEHAKAALREIYANSAKYLAEVQSYLQHMEDIRYAEG